MISVRLNGLGMKRGAFIVFEGIDRSGKSTQCMKLVEKLKKQEIPSELIQFPDRSTSIGKTINNYLTNKEDYSDQAIHLLFTANRWENEMKMKKLLNEGVTLVVDRYCYSGIAYSCAKSGMSMDWCKQPESGLPKPDLVIFLSMISGSASDREGFGGERYEESNFQEKVKETYLKLKDDTWKIIDGGKSIEEVHKEVFEHVKKTIEDNQGKELQLLW